MLSLQHGTPQKTLNKIGEIFRITKGARMNMICIIGVQNIWVKELKI